MAGVPELVTLSAARRFYTTPLGRSLTLASPARSLVRAVGLSMPQLPDFSVIDVGETPTFGMDFSAWLTSGVTLSAITSFTVTNLFPGAENFAEVIGTPAIGTIPISKGGSGVANVGILFQLQANAYGKVRVTAAFSTSDEQKLIGWAYVPIEQP